MKGVTSWSYKPYRPPLFPTGDIYICRVVPSVEGFAFWWLPLDGEGGYTVFWRERGSESWNTVPVDGETFSVDGLDTGVDYEFYVERGDKRSRIRLARTGVHPGTAVNYLHPDDDAYSFSGHYLCSPSLVRHPDGFLLASMDVFAGSMPQDLALIFRSDDDGASWYYYNELFPCFWPRMFIHRGVLYVMCVSTEYGDLLIGKSTDGGKTFGVPTVLLRGSGRVDVNGVHKNPTCVAEYDGRLWTALEYGCWAKGDHAVMLASVDADADLLDAASWSFTEPVPYDPSWPSVAKGPSRGCIEGNAIPSPDGTKLYNILRYTIGGCDPSWGLAMVMRCDTEHPEAPLVYDRVIRFPGNHSKFEITRDEKTGMYISIISRIRNASCSGHRNLLSLAVSPDLMNWEVALDLHDYTDCKPKFVGMQYVAYLIEGDDLLYLSRTGISGAKSFHDTNYITFHRLKDFRKYLNDRA